MDKRKIFIRAERLEGTERDYMIIGGIIYKLSCEGDNYLLHHTGDSRRTIENLLGLAGYPESFELNITAQDRNPAPEPNEIQENTDEETLQIPISDLFRNGGYLHSARGTQIVRIQQLLQHTEAETIGDLLKNNMEYYFSFKGVGQKTFQDLQRALETDYGVRIRD